MRTLIVVFLVACLAAAAAVVVLPAPAFAACTRVIYAERASTNGITTQIVGRTSSLSTFLFFADTTDPEIARMIAPAVAQRNRVQVNGDAAQCPTTGDFRDMGTITSIFISP